MGKTFFVYVIGGNKGVSEIETIQALVRVLTILRTLVAEGVTDVIICNGGDGLLADRGIAETTRSIFRICKELGLNVKVIGIMNSNVHDQMIKNDSNHAYLTEIVVFPFPTDDEIAVLGRNCRYAGRFKSPEGSMVPYGATAKVLSMGHVINAVWVFGLKEGTITADEVEFFKAFKGPGVAAEGVPITVFF